jgi:hypothetical protein
MYVENVPWSDAPLFLRRYRTRAAVDVGDRGPS